MVDRSTPPASPVVQSAARLAVLHSTGLLDSPPESAFDALTRRAAEALTAPVALVSLVDAERQFFKSCLGLPAALAAARETPLSHSFFKYVVASGAPLAVDDAPRHPLVHDNGSVVDHGVRAYLGVPLVTDDGHTLGSLCVLDWVAREWSARDVAVLTALADAAVVEIDLRRDATRRRRAEAALRESEERFRALSASSPVGIFHADVDGRVTYANPRLQRLWGVDEAALLGTGWKTRVHRDDVEELRAAWRAAQAAGGEFSREYRVCLPGGEVRWVHGRSAPLRDASGAAAGSVGTVEDVTERRRAEGALRQAQKMEALGQLAGGIAHDFNNLLTVISSYGQLALGALDPRDPVHADVQEMTRAATHAAELTRQLLAFSRTQLLHPRVVDLTQTVAAIEPMLRRLIGEDIEVVTRVEPALGHVLADPGQMEQVLVNLAVNARDAMPDGGVLMIETANVELDEAAARRVDPAAPPGAYVRLAVRDTGVGIEPGAQARVFEPFFTTKPVGRGTGLGLAMVHGIVRQSRGYVSVASVPGCGATFELHLPRAEPAAADAGAAADGEAPTPAGAGAAVLLVEDDAAVRAVARRALERDGYRVLEASRGADALAIAAHPETRIDLVLTDMVMPEMSGRALAEQLAAVRPGVRVLFMSGYTDDDIRRRGLLEPGMTVVEKPFTPASLCAAVRAAVSGAGR